MKNQILLIISILALGFASNAQWVQIGEDINGYAGDYSGSSVSMSSDGSIVAIGAPINGANGSSAGHVRIYQNNNGIWTQLGEDINGAAENDQFGNTVSLSSDGTTIAIGAWKGTTDNGAFSGYARIYRYIDDVWSQIGQTIDGEAEGDEFGDSVSLNSEGNIVAIGAARNDANGNASGHVRVYQSDGGNWTQLGEDIDGEFQLAAIGYSVSLSSDGHTMATGTLSTGGDVLIFHFEGVWTQVGEDIEPEGPGEGAGWSISLSSDGSILAIGAPLNNAVGPPVLPGSGHVRVYQNIGGVWSQVGQDIDGESSGDHSGWSVSLSSDGNTVAIGAPDNGPNPFDAGQVRIYQNNNGVWTEVGEDIDGEGTGDKSGTSVSLSSDGNTVAIGAPFNDDNGGNAGQVRVYTHIVDGISEMDLSSIRIHPNPTTGQIQIDLKNAGQKLTLNIYNSFGELIHTELLSNVSSFKHTLPETNGLYLVKLVGEDGYISTVRVVKQ